MPSLLLRNLFFTILQPGLVAGLIPYFIVRDTLANIWSNPFQWNHMVGLLIMVIGLLILLHCVYMFAKEGRGTLSPVDPTKALVAKGLYRYVRNPMYIGVMTILIGEAVFTSSMKLWLYAGLIFILFHLFIVFVEEPRLKRDFGEAYDSYRKSVGRWF